MKRYSILWWSVILPTSVVVGIPTFFIVRQFTDWGFFESAAVALVATLVADIVIAASMEAVAPTRVDIGPGEKVLDSEIPNETATIIGGFDASPHGQVSIRGETWSATRSPDEAGVLTAGTVVTIVDRDGLNLVVTAKSS